jgi:hypothetical protein
MRESALTSRTPKASFPLKVPDNLIAEIIDGELVTSPCPASPHARATPAIRVDIDPFDTEMLRLRLLMAR